MRRSKSDPAKYARNYRKISQRRMTQYDHLDEEQEIKRLRSILKDSEAHLLRGTEDNDNNEESSDKRSNNSKRKRKEWDKKDEKDTSEQQQQQPALEQDSSSILSPELLAEAGGADELIILPSKKKPKKKQSKVQLTAEEIKEAKALQKKTTRKLQQLETRAAQKLKRAELYEKLEKHQISSTALSLLSRSGQISRKDTETKKQALQRLVKKERAGLELSTDEQDLLYPERGQVGAAPDVPAVKEKTTSKSQDTNSKTSVKKEKNNKKAKKDSLDEESDVKKDTKKDSLLNDPTDDGVQPMDDDSSSSSSSDDDEEATATEKTNDTISKTQETASASFDFAAQMMASLSTLKDETEKKAEEEAKNVVIDEEDKSFEPAERYVPSVPTLLKTAATLGLKSSSVDARRKVLAIQRPEAVEEARYNLPVSAMEFEIMDSIRNNDVTIICGETGSGKSTQVPQYVYESGMCLNEADPNGSFLVGITQPRRVAAVSTAKRVCYEMGCGDGQIIKSAGKRGNTVSYRTRYETAGSGTDTRVQFMTDGILLQEIQTDLLLRRYSVIVLDESHERNLNTDVLIGLLSVALPLRKQAAEEDPTLVPLKLVLMSATLRVEDFTKNDKLFPTGPPAVVNVPGRTFPVTVHHNKETELDNYGKGVSSATFLHA
jgi:ATP-dependent RNA helicase DHX37/DHR1